MALPPPPHGYSSRSVEADPRPVSTDKGEVQGDPVKGASRQNNIFAVRPERTLSGRELPAKAVRIPVIGMGGIMNGADAVEFLLAGARAVAVGTANFVDPFAPLKVIDGINEYLDRHGCRSVSEIVGALEA